MWKGKVLATVLIMGLLSGCSNEPDPNTIKMFVEQCKGKVAAELYYGSWSTSVTFKCNDYDLKKENKLTRS